MRTLIFILFPICLSAQFKKDLQVVEPQLNLPTPEDVRRGRVLEFIGYPMFALSGMSYGMSEKFREIDSSNSHRPGAYAIGASVGFVTSTGVWGTGMVLQGKPKWSDLYKLVGVLGFSTLGYYTGQQVAEIFPSK